MFADALGARRAGPGRGADHAGSRSHCAAGHPLSAAEAQCQGLGVHRESPLILLARRCRSVQVLTRAEMYNACGIPKFQSIGTIC